MSSTLEKAIQYLLNEEHEQANAELHRFIVERARQIHEANRYEDTVLEEGWDDELQLEKYFGENDFDDMESVEGDVGADMGDVDQIETDLDMGDDMGADLGDDMGVEGDDLGDDMGADLGDEGEAGVEGDVEDRLADIEDGFADLEAELERLTAEFEAMMNDSDGAEGDLGDVGGDDLDLDLEGGDIEDDMGGEEVEEGALEVEINHEDEDFDDITESVVDELEKVSLSLEDGKEIGAGSKISQNRASNVGDRNKAAKPVEQKVTNHTGFEREPAPGVKDMKARKNTMKKGDQTLSKVPDGGDKSALLNKKH